MSRNRWFVGAVALTVGMVAAAGALAQSPGVVDGADQAALAQQQELSRIEGARAQVIREILDQWSSSLRPANWEMNDDGGLGALTAALRRASAERLLAASRAQSFDELEALLGARGEDPGMVRLEPGQAIPSTLGSTAGDLVFTPLTPCRIIDTRLASGGLAGRIGPNTGKQFQVNMADYSTQGGFAGTCGLGFRVEAVAVNIVSTDQTGVGNLRVIQSGGGIPNAALLNYTPGVNLANGAVVRSSATSGLGDIYIYSGNSSSHVVVDIMGFFTAPEATALQCLTTADTVVSVPAGNNANATAPACATGYTATATFCESSSWDMPFVYQSGGVCSAKNLGGGSADLRAAQRCCRVPGR
jgi:hypothetical protein